jgi:hypothetical protein
MMVVGRSSTLLKPRSVALARRTVRVGRARCAVPSRTVLAGLVATRLSVKVTDAAGCDPAALFVARIGHDANRGQAGWQYKVGHASPSLGAGDPSGRIRSGSRVLWFWCVKAAACQRTLEVRPAARTVAPGTALVIRVTGYDDNGKGKAIGGATVHLGFLTAVSAADGSVTVAAPAHAGRYQLAARKAGLVPSFPVEVVVG